MREILKENVSEFFEDKEPFDVNWFTKFWLSEKSLLEVLNPSEQAPNA